MSEQLRRAMQEAVGGQPPVADWVGPVRRGLRARARRRTASQAAAGAALAVTAAVVGAVVLGDPTGGALVQQDVATPPPAMSPTPSPAPPGPSPSPSPGPSTGSSTASRPPGPVTPPAPPGARAADPALPDEVAAPGPVLPSPDTGGPRPTAAPRRSPASSPTAAASASPRPTPTPTPTAAPTAGAQQVVVTLSPEGSTVDAGETVFTVTATGDAEVPPRVLALRVDGQPVESDPAVSCAAPSSAPPRSPQRATRSFTVTLPPGEHLVEAVADSGCSWYRGRGRTSRTVTAR